MLRIFRHTIPALFFTPLLFSADAGAEVGSGPVRPGVEPSPRPLRSRSNVPSTHLKQPNKTAMPVTLKVSGKHKRVSSGQQPPGGLSHRSKQRTGSSPQDAVPRPKLKPKPKHKHKHKKHKHKRPRRSEASGLPRVNTSTQRGVRTPCLLRDIWNAARTDPYNRNDFKKKNGPVKDPTLILEAYPSILEAYPSGLTVP